MEQIDYNLMEHIKQEIKQKTPEEIKDLREKITWLGFWAELTAYIQDQISEILQEKVPNHKLDWDNETIIKEMIKNKHITAIEGTEWEHEWIIININLPKTENFEWFNRKYFISKDYLTKDEIEKEIEKQPKYREKLASMENVAETLENIKQYMKTCWIEIDESIDDYLEYLKPENFPQRCDAWDILKWIHKTSSEIEWLRLKDKDDDSRAVWSWLDDNCFFNRYGFDSSRANLFLIVN